MNDDACMNDAHAPHALDAARIKDIQSVVSGSNQCGSTDAAAMKAAAIKAAVPMAVAESVDHSAAAVKAAAIKAAAPMRQQSSSAAAAIKAAAPMRQQSSSAAGQQSMRASAALPALHAHPCLTTL